MNLKTRLILIPSLLAAGVLGACGPEGANEGAGVSTPAAPDVEVVEGAETPVVGEDQAGATEGDTGDIGVGEDQADAMTTPDAATEDQAGAVTTPDAAAEDQAAVTTPDAATEDQAGAATTPDAAAEDQAGAVTTPDAATEEQAGAATTPGMEQFDMMSAYKASEFIGYQVQNLEGEDLGEIEDLIVDTGSSQVKYAVLSFGGFLDIGDKLFAIPLDAIQFNPDEQAFILDVDEERLEQAPGFERENWPDTTTPDWDMGYNDFWLDGMNDTVGETEGTVQDDATQDQAEAATTPDTATEEQAEAATTPDAAAEEQAEAATTPDVASQDQAATGDQDTMTDEPMAGAVVRASEIIDDQIFNSQGEELGYVEDLIIQVTDQHMAYAVLDLSEMDDELAETGDTVESDDTAQTDAAAAQTDEEAVEDKLYAIPLNNLQFNPEEDTFVFNADPQMLDTALSFSEDEWSNQMNLEDVN
jgi:sporulation protein YlmC with PRC-barrel domain